jgi:hypothetical protein
MRIEMTGRGPALAMTRAALAGLALLLAAGLAGCTTVEGTNAMTDVGTFEREVMTSTLQGLGAVPQDEKQPLVNKRGPLVMPKTNGNLPSPQSPAAETAAIPADSNMVQIDTAGLSQEDIDRFRHARVVDLRSLSGRPLTEAEAKQLTAKFRGAQIKGTRPLTLPPDEYFTVVNGQDMVCMAENGDLVSLNDKRCPKAVKQALGPRSAGAGSIGTGGPDATLSKDEITN